MIQKVDNYITKNKKWVRELAFIRDILLDTELEETIKWGTPVYTLGSKNILGLGAFKNHYGIWFFNGVYLKDNHQLLVNAQESTKAMRQLRFDASSKVDPIVLNEYIIESIENQKNGLEFKVTRSKTYDMPKLLQSRLDEDENLKTSFISLSFGKQKAYSNYINEAKQEKTKLSRLDKITSMIIQGIGLNDKYRNC